MAINEGIESLRELFRGRPGASRRCDEGIWTGVRLVFGEFAASEPLKSQRTILRIHSNLPGPHRYGSDDRVEIVSIRFAQCFDRHNRGVEVQPFDFSFDQSALSDLNGLAAKRDFIRLGHRTHGDAFKIPAQNIRVESTGIEKRLHRLALDLDCLDYATHRLL